MLQRRCGRQHPHRRQGNQSFPALCFINNALFFEKHRRSINDSKVICFTQLRNVLSIHSFILTSDLVKVQYYIGLIKTEIPYQPCFSGLRCFIRCLSFFLSRSPSTGVLWRCAEKLIRPEHQCVHDPGQARCCLHPRSPEESAP